MMHGTVLRLGCSSPGELINTVRPIPMPSGEVGLRAEGPLELILEDELEDLFRRRTAVECGIRGQ